jgi:phosphoribosylformylglycinamidine synthase
LIIGICNGFQVLTNLGLLPGTLVHNDGARFLDRWVDVEITANKSPWLSGLEGLSLPVAHGEGKYYADAQTLSNINADIESGKRSVLRYSLGEISSREKQVANPNGSISDIAGLTSTDGRVLGLMPHPERAIFFHHLPHWTYLREEYRREGRSCPEYGPGLMVFKNAVKYFLGAEELSLR